MSKFGMNVFYISHPYTGNEDNNRAKAIYLTAKLAARYPQIVFINPLAAMYHTMTAELDYDTVMSQCKELIRRSDGVIMLGNWRESKGCNTELDFAVKNRKFVWDGADEFEKAMVDEFGYDEETTEGERIILAKQQENGVLLDGLKKERAEIIELYKKHEITAAQCIAEKNRLDELIRKASGKK